MRFEAAPEYQVFPTPDRPLQPYVAAVRAAKESRPLLRELDPDAVVADILTVAAGLAAELEERPWVTLVPHVLPTHEPGFPPYSIGARLPRTALGQRLWTAARPFASAGEQRGRDELNGARARVGLPPLDHVQGGISGSCRSWRPSRSSSTRAASWETWARVTGPLMWEQPYGDTEAPPGDDPLVLVAPSTSQDPDQRMLRAALEGLAGEPVRVLATTNRRHPAEPLPCPRTRGSWTGSPTRARCRAAPPWCATRGTAPWPARWPAACRWWHAPPPATWRRTRRGWAGRASVWRCPGDSRRRAVSGWR